MDLRALVKVANRLDSLGLTKEADTLDRLINKMAAEDTAFADQVVKNLQLFSGMITTTKSKNFWPGSPLENMIRYIAGKSGPNMTHTDIVKTLIGAYDHTIGQGAYNKLSDTEKSVFQGMIVGPLLDRAAEQRKTAPAAPEAGVAMMEGSTYPRANTQTIRPPSTKRELPKETVKMDWSYYVSKTDDPVGKNMEKHWSRVAPLLDMGTDYDSFRTWYKAVGATMSPSQALMNMYNSALAMSKDPMITRVRDSRAMGEKNTREAVYSYLGLNLNTMMPSTGAEKYSAVERLKVVGGAMESEKPEGFNFNDEEEFEFSS